MSAEERRIYNKGQVGPEPEGYYIYRWGPGEIGRYVGRGGGGSTGRWSDHLKPSANDPPLKMRYFRRYKKKLACFIVVENLTRAEVGDRESEEIKRHGFFWNGTGTLLNDRDGSPINGPRGKRDLRDCSGHYQAYKAQPAFALDATIKLVSPTNPWRGPPKRCPGWHFYKKLLSKAPATVGATIELGAKAGIKAAEVQKHLRWLYTWEWGGPYIEIDGQIYAASARIKDQGSSRRTERKVKSVPKGIRGDT
jgi:hypothetical protein